MCLHTFIYFMYSYLIQSSSWCHTNSIDIPDPFLPPFSIIHCLWQVFRHTSHICTELLYVGPSWSSFLCLYMCMWRGRQVYVTYEFAPTSLAVSCMSGLSNFDSFLVVLPLLIHVKGSTGVCHMSLSLLL